MDFNRDLPARMSKNTRSALLSGMVAHRRARSGHSGLSPLIYRPTLIYLPTLLSNFLEFLTELVKLVEELSTKINQSINHF